MRGQVRVGVVCLGALAATFLVLIALGIAGVFGTGPGGGGPIETLVGGALVAPYQFQSTGVAHASVSGGLSAQLECARGLTPPGAAFTLPGRPGTFFTCVKFKPAPLR